MKRIISIVLISVMLFSISCFAELNYFEVLYKYSELTYDEYINSCKDGSFEKDCYVYCKITKIIGNNFYTISINNIETDIIIDTLNIECNIKENDELLIFGWLTRDYNKWDYSYSSYLFTNVIINTITKEIIYNPGNYEFINKETDPYKEHKTVKVPAGFYEIGKDIPAGNYCITFDSNGKDTSVGIKYGTELNECKSDLEYYTYEAIYDVNHKNYSGQTSYFNITLNKGMYIRIDSEVIFTYGKRKIKLDF